jgi:hypothetical protein
MAFKPKAKTKAKKVAASPDAPPAFTNVSVRVSAKPRAAYERAAKQTGMTLSEWIRASCDVALVMLNERRRELRAEKKVGAPSKAAPETSEAPEATTPKRVRKTWSERTPKSKASVATEDDAPQDADALL